MKVFHFFRHEDASGVSGTGPVAEGVQFTNGWCALRWMSSKSSLCFYQSIDEVKAIHGHGGKTELVMSEISAPNPARSGVLGGRKADSRFEMILKIIDETGSLAAMLEEPALDEKGFSQSLARIRNLVGLLEQERGP